MAIFNSYVSLPEGTQNHGPIVASWPPARLMDGRGDLIDVGQVFRAPGRRVGLSRSRSGFVSWEKPWLKKKNDWGIKNKEISDDLVGFRVRTC